MTSENANEDLPAGIGNVPPSALGDWAPIRRRRWPFVVAAVVLVLGGLIALGPAMISGSWLNGVIRDWLAKNVETPVTFDRLDVSWGDGIRISGLAVRDRVGREDPLLYVPEVEMEASIVSLFVRHLDVERLVFHDATVRIEHEGGGRLNSEDVVKMERKKRRKTRKGDGADTPDSDPDEPAEVLVLPAIDVPIDVRNLTLVFVSEDGAEVSRPGITFRGDVTTRNGPTTFSLAVPGESGKTVLSVKGEATLFDAEGMFLPDDQLAVTTTLTLAGVDAVEQGDLLALFAGEAPVAGVLDGRIDLRTKGRSAQGDLELVLRGVAVGDAVGTRGGDEEDLRVAGAFRADADGLELDALTLRGAGLEADANIRGPYDALEGTATVSGDLTRSAAALRALGIDLPAGIAGMAEGAFEFTPSPSRGHGRMTLTGLHVPPLGDATEALHIESASVGIEVTPLADRVTIDRLTVSAPGLSIAAKGSLGHDGAVEIGVTMDGDVSELAAHGRALGVVPRDFALAGDLTGKIRTTLSPGDAGPHVRIDELVVANEGMRVTVAGGLERNGTLDVRLDGRGSVESLVVAAPNTDGAPRREVRGTFEVAAALTGTRDAPHAELERLVIAGDLDVDARGEAPADGSLEATLSVQGAVRDAIALMRSLGLVEGDVPLDGAIDLRVSLAGTRERPEIPVASLRVTGGPVTVDATATLGMDGEVGGSFRALADVDALWRIAHAQGLLAREHSTGGVLSADGVLDGTRDAPEIPTATMRITGPVEVRLDASLDAAQQTLVACDFRGALAPAGNAIAAVLGIDPHRLLGDYEGKLSIEGPLDALEINLTHMAVRTGEFTADGRGTLLPDGGASSTVVLRGPLSSAVELLRAAGVARELDAAGVLDASIELRVTEGDGDRLLVGAIDAAAFDVNLSRHAESEDESEKKNASVYAEKEIRLSIPTVRVSLEDKGWRPMRGELSVGRRLNAIVSVEGGRDLNATATVNGRLQPLLDAAAFALGGQAHVLAADLDAEFHISGKPDDPDVDLRVLRILADDGSLDVDGSGERRGGRLSASGRAKGDVFAFVTLAQTAGIASDLRATGRVDAQTALSLDGDTLVVSKLRAHVDDLLVTEPKIGEGRFSEPRIRLDAAEFSVDLATRAVTGLRPHLTMEGFDVTATVETRAGDSPEDSDTPPLLLETRGTLHVLEAFVENHPELFPDTHLGELHTPFHFAGDVSGGRERADSWTGSFDARVTDLRVPYANVASAAVEGKIAEGALVLDPIVADVNGGSATGTATIGLLGEKPQHHSALEAENVEITGELAPLLARISPLLAKGDAGTLGGRVGVRGATFTAKGLDGDVLKRTISGDGTLLLAGVHVESNNWVGKVLDYIGAGKRLEVTSAEVPFVIRRGRVETGSVDIGGRDLDLRMGGIVATDGTLDYRFGIKPHEIGGAFEKLAKLLDDDGFLPLRLEGDISSPSLELPSVKDIAGGAIKDLIGGLKDKLDGKDEEDDDEADDEGLSDEEKKRRRRERRKRKKAREAEEAEEAAKKAKEQDPDDEPVPDPEPGPDPDPEPESE